MFSDFNIYRYVVRYDFLDAKNARVSSSEWTPCCLALIIIQWRYSPTGLWPTERPPPVSEASANFCG